MKKDMKKAIRRRQSSGRSLANRLPPPMLRRHHTRLVWYTRDGAVEMWQSWEHCGRAGDDTTLNEIRVQERESFHQRHQSHSMQTAACRDRADLVRVLRGLPLQPVVFAPAPPVSTAR